MMDMSSHSMDPSMKMPMTTNMPMPMPMPGMKMYFHFGYEQHILFKEWIAESDGAVFGYCVLFFILALIYELLKYYRHLHLSNASLIKYNLTEENGTVNNSTVTHDSQNDSQISGDRYERPLHRREVLKRQAIKMLSIAHLIQTVLHMIQIFVSYILMLSFMLFNVWICLAVILGAGIGYFLVGSRRLTTYSAIDDDHCH